MISVLISGTSGIYLALYATGGIVCILGFIFLGIIWLATTILSFNSIRNGNIENHKNLIIYSYAACFAAVTLRIWLPILEILLESFIIAYSIVAWLSWIPNIIFAYFLINKTKSVAV